MSKLKISYFDVNVGRTEPIRLAFHIGGIEFEDHRFPFSEFEKERKIIFSSNKNDKKTVWN